MALQLGSKFSDFAIATICTLFSSAFVFATEATPVISAKPSSTDTNEKLLVVNGDANRTNRKGQTELMLAALRGPKSRILEHAKRSDDLEARDEDGMTATLYSARSKDPEALLTMMQLGGNWEAVDKQGNTALIHAAMGDSVPAIDLLFDHEVYENRPNSLGQTPLLLAAQHGSLRAVNALIRHGAYVDETANDGSTALTTAAYHGHMEVVKALIAAGADKTPKTKGLDAVAIARIRGESEIFKLLSATPSSRTITTQDVFTAVHKHPQGSAGATGAIVVAGGDADAKAYLCTSVVGQTTLSEFQIVFQNYFNRTPFQNSSEPPGELLRPLLWSHRIEGAPPEASRGLAQTMNSQLLGGFQIVPEELNAYASGEYMFGNIKAGRETLQLTPDTVDDFHVLASLGFKKGVLHTFDMPICD